MWFGGIFGANHGQEKEDVQEENDSQPNSSHENVENHKADLVEVVAVDCVENHNDDQTKSEEGRTVLLDCIQDMRWSEALIRLDEAPEESKVMFKAERMVPDNDFDSNDNLSSDNIYFYPLHLACHFLHPKTADDEIDLATDLVLELIKVFPDAVKTKDHSGRLPIHIVCYKGTSGKRMDDKGVDTVLLSLVTAYKDGLMKSDYRGGLPLHNACKSGHLSETDIEYLINSCPCSKECIDFFSDTPYSLAIKNFSPTVKYNRHRLLRLLDPTCTKSHVRMKQNIQTTKIRKTNNVFSKEQSMVGVDVVGLTVLFSHVSESCWEDVIARCSEYKNDASTWYIEKKSKSNDTCLVKKPQVRILPIHRACEMVGVPVSAIDALIQAFPKSVEEKDQSGRLPIHSACWKNASYDVINRLARFYTKGLSIGDCHQSLPLHIACQFGASSDVIALLLELCPDAATMKDSFGRTALDVTAYHYNSNKVAVLKLLQRHDHQPSAPLLIDKKSSNSFRDDTSRTFPLSQDNSIVGDTKLYHLIDAEKWSEAVERCDAQPSEAKVWFEELSRDGTTQARLLPIHLACLLHPRVEIIKALISAFPESVSCRDHGGRLPLHSAVWRDADEEVIEYLINVDKSSVLLRDNEGRLPLHIACEFGVSVKLVNVLVSCNPGSIFERDRLDRNALNITASSYFYNKYEVAPILEKALWSSAKESTEDQSKSFESTNEQKEMSLYSLVSKKERHSKVLERLKNHPEEASRWVQKRNNSGKIEWKLLPIHRLCEQKPTLYLIKRLVNAYPQGLILTDHHGRLPIHSICKHANTGEEDSIKVIEFLVKTQRKSLMFKDLRGRLPLHVALKYKAHRKVVEVLLSACPLSASVRDKLGRLPLHIACLEGSDTRTIFNLFWSHQEALIQQDNNGSTPLDYATTSSYENKEEVVSILLGFKDEYFDHEYSNTSNEKHGKSGKNRVSWHQNVDTYGYDTVDRIGEELERSKYDESVIQSSKTFDAQTAKDFEPQKEYEDEKERSNGRKSRFIFGSIGESIRRVASGPM